MSRIQYNVETITPAKATEYLKKSGKNRALSPDRVNELARAMKNGKFGITHQGIAFDVNGLLRDGQHRLAAVVASGCAVNMTVARGLPDQVVLHVDEGRPRSDCDALIINGLSTTKLRVAIAKVLWNIYCKQQFGISWQQGAKNKPSRELLVSILDRNREAIDFSFRKGMKVGAIVHGAIVCAWWTANRDRLSEFVDQLVSGRTESENDSALIRFRDWVREQKGKGSTNVRQEILGKCWTALEYYLEYKPMIKLCNRSTAGFRLPVISEWEDFVEMNAEEEAKP